MASRLWKKREPYGRVRFIGVSIGQISVGEDISPASMLTVRSYKTSIQRPLERISRMLPPSTAYLESYSTVIRRSSMPWTAMQKLCG